MMKKIILSFLFSIFGILLTNGQFAKEMTVENEQIPPEFSQFEGTLLIVSQYKAWDKYAKKAFDANYKGKYKFVSKKDNESDYDDLDTYRYMLSPSFSSSLNSAPGSSFGSSHTSSERLVLLDRKTGKQYKTRSTAFYGKLLKAYAEALELERSK
jgi:hypothetical protein